VGPIFTVGQAIEAGLNAKAEEFRELGGENSVKSS
jgi:hypothetical protein